MAISARSPNLAESRSSPAGKRLNVLLSEKAQSDLEAVAGGRSLSELVRLAMRLLKIALEESKGGNRLVVVDAKGNAKREIVIPE